MVSRCAWGPQQARAPPDPVFVLFSQSDSLSVSDMGRLKEGQGDGREWTLWMSAPKRPGGEDLLSILVPAPPPPIFHPSQLLLQPLEDLHLPVRFGGRGSNVLLEAQKPRFGN